MFFYKYHYAEVNRSMSLKITFNLTSLVNKFRPVLSKAKMDASRHEISNEYTEVYRRIPLKIQLAYGVGHVLNDVCASMWFTYLLVFFHLVLEFNNWETGFMLLVGQVADALATPFVGYHSDQSDNFWFCRYGKRKTWHLFGTVCVLFAFPFIFSPCVGCADNRDWGQIFYYCMFIIIFQFGWAAVQISHLSLIPELTPNEHDRTKLTAIRYSFTVISNVLVYVITWAVLHMNNGGNSKIGPNDGPKFQQVVWAVLVFGTFCSSLFHILIHEAENGVGHNVRGGQLRSSVGDILRNLRVYQIAVVYMSSRLFVNLSQVFVPLYLHESLDMPGSSLALVPLIMFIGSFFTSLFIERVNRWLGRRLIYSLGALLGVAACIWIKFGAGSLYVAYYIYLVALLIGSAGSIVLVTSLGVTTDFIGEKTDSGAFVYGIMSFTDKLANGIAVVIIQYLHKDVSNTNYYRDVLTNVCGVSIVLGAVAVIGFACKARRNTLVYETVPDYNSIN
ncbi:Major facilitator superfamily domain-containing protein 12 [Gonioctena quinquepunctata]|nr:Major facilitator superfamily domain-containing protein 12 [Gonioctena quinquepunctata]